MSESCGEHFGLGGQPESRPSLRTGSFVLLWVLRVFGEEISLDFLGELLPVIFGLSKSAWRGSICFTPHPVPICLCLC